jgi:hypothetical protein
MALRRAPLAFVRKPRKEFLGTAMMVFGGERGENFKRLKVDERMVFKNASDVEEARTTPRASREREGAMTGRQRAVAILMEGDQ